MDTKTKIVEFIKKWWRVAVCALVILLLCFSAGDCLSVAEKHSFVGMVGFIGAFIAVCIFVAIMMTEIHNNKRPSGR